MKLNTIKRVFIYTAKHLFRDPVYFLTYCVAYMKKGYVPLIKYYEYSKLPELLNGNKSIIRLGDGDMYTIMGGGQPFQEYSVELRNKLREIIESYSDNSRYILCLNKRPLEKTNKELKQLNLINCWLPTKVYFNLYFNKQATYHDAAMFYYVETLPRYFEEYLSNKKIIIASNDENINRLQNNEKLPFKDINFIRTPKINAFSALERITSEIIKIVENTSDKKVVVLAGFGPASKVLAYNLVSQVQVIDIGHGIEFAYGTEGMDKLLP